MAIEVARWLTHAARKTSLTLCLQPHVVSCGSDRLECARSMMNIPCQCQHFNISFPNVWDLAILKKVNPEIYRLKVGMVALVFKHLEIEKKDKAGNI